MSKVLLGELEVVLLSNRLAVTHPAAHDVRREVVIQFGLARRPHVLEQWSKAPNQPDGRNGAKLPLALFAIQLVLNSLWSVLFFGLQNPGAAAVEIVLLWAAILATLIAFWKRSFWAGGWCRIWRG